MPKQFLPLVDPNKTLLQKTFERAIALTKTDPSSVIIVTHETQAETARQQLGNHSPIILTEPLSRNTAPAIALAADYVAKNHSPDDIMFILPCDGHIEDETELHKALATAETEAQGNKIIIFGIKPTRPETGYGYIKTGAENGLALTVDRFVEKPDAGTALQYLQSGDYLWNSGMVVFKTSTVMEEFEALAPDILENLDNYDSIRSVSFDIAILERSDRLSVIPCALEWSDVGTWTGLFEILRKNGSDEDFINKFKRLGN